MVFAKNPYMRILFGFRCRICVLFCIYQHTPRTVPPHFTTHFIFKGFYVKSIHIRSVIGEAFPLTVRIVCITLENIEKSKHSADTFKA